jgi:hypothetical protein
VNQKGLVDAEISYSRSSEEADSPFHHNIKHIFFIWPIKVLFEIEQSFCIVNNNILENLRNAQRAICPHQHREI